MCANFSSFHKLMFSEGFDIKWEDVESKFAVVVTEKKDADAGPKKAEKTVVVFLDPKIAQNLNIWAAKFKRTMSNKEIILAVQNLDRKTFDQQAVTALVGFIPTADEVRFFSLTQNVELCEFFVSSLEPVNFLHLPVLASTTRGSPRPGEDFFQGDPSTCIWYLVIL